MGGGGNVEVGEEALVCLRNGGTCSIEQVC